MEQLSTTIQSKELKNSEICFTKDLQVSEKGQHYVILDNEKYNICLFPIQPALPTGKKSYIRFNARVYFKLSGIVFYMPVRQMADDGSLIAGQAAKTSGFRAVVTEWIPEKATAFERMIITDKQFIELMSIIRAGTAA